MPLSFKAALLKALVCNPPRNVTHHTVSKSANKRLCSAGLCAVPSSLSARYAVVRNCICHNDTTLVSCNGHFSIMASWFSGCCEEVKFSFILLSCRRLFTVVFRSVVIKVEKGNAITNLHQHQDLSARSRSSSKFSEHCSFVDFLVHYTCKENSVLVCWLPYM